MRVWIDMTNSPHVLFFAPIIKELKRGGHKVMVTSREHSQTLELLSLYKIESIAVGKHAGASKIRKALFVPARIFALVKTLRGEKIDACVVHQSFYGIVASYFLRIKKRIYIFDNERAFWQNFFAIPFATKALCPEAIPGERMFFRNIAKYPGIKEAVYLSGFAPDKKILNELRLSAKKKIIVMRPEPYSAAYYAGKKNVLYPLIGEIIEKRPEWQVVVIPRDAKQRSSFKSAFGSKIVITGEAIDAPSLLSFASIMIGAGGTMNREAAVLGVPVISLYGEELLAVDRWLIEKGFMKHARSASLKDVEALVSLKHKSRKIPDGKKAILGAILG